jgi:aryl-alcohol dehydrogenase-like predicted oxidoreductase
LGLDYIDLYQSHSSDSATPIEETLRAFDDLVRQGKVRFVGCSNYSAVDLVSALDTSARLGLARYDCLQPHYSLVKRAEFEPELAGICRQNNLGVIPYSPLGGGFLTGKYRPDGSPHTARENSARRHFSQRNWELLDLMSKLGREKGEYSTSQIALAWLLTDPLITSPIIGPRTPEQLHDNLGAAGLQLTEQEKSQLDKASDWRE